MHSNSNTEDVPASVEKPLEADADQPEKINTTVDLENIGADKTEEKVEKPIGDEEDIVYPTGSKLALILFGNYIAIFLVALDRTIIATAIPRITDQFHSLNDVGWYAGAYLITAAGTQLIWGRIFTFYTTKYVFLTAIIIFEIGSAICGSAPNSVAFIIGRAIAGAGSAGVFSGTTLLVTQVVPLGRRPILIGLVGAIFAVASVAGPLLGGAFTDSKATWRWCFYINLPLGAIILSVLILILKPKPVSNPTTLRQKIGRLDPLGTLFFLPGIICLLLALQWGGTTYAWSSGRIIALFVLFGLLITTFICIQIRQQENATIPPRIFAYRNVHCGMLYTLSVGGGMVSILYGLPIWFQAVRGVSAVHSGIDTLPMVMALVVGATGAGALTTATGWYNPFLFFCVVMMSVGSGLISTFQVDTGHAAFIGYQVIFGLGLGTGAQQASIAAQAVLKQKDVATGISVMFFAQSLGGSIFVAVAQTLFDNDLLTKLSQIANIDPQAVLSAGATGVRDIVSPGELPTVLFAYNEALRRSFYVTVAVSCLAIVPACGFQWVNVKGKKHA
ncbi:MAG: hypothetical protein MMC33_007735 [Icmadophila ericetorum]|nr:hypothetical protein [Icmadophila ericetorum]